jgi:hypothetical protein
MVKKNLMKNNDLAVYAVYVSKTRRVGAAALTIENRRLFGLSSTFCNDR